MQTRICQTLLLVFLFCQFTAFAQNGPPTIEQVRAGLNRGIERDKIPLEGVFRTEVRHVSVGADSIPIQIYYPSDKRDLPILYYIHGGAFVIRFLDSDIARVLCNRTGSVVVSVDYRVAPEHSFPTSINDGYAVWNWIADNAKRIQGNPNKISLIGDSAGGLFTASLQVKRQQEGRPARPLSLVFVNPGVDLRPTAPGADEYSIVVNWYLNGTDPNNPLASPILATNFKDYAPSLIIVCEKDEIRQHGVLLADKLKGAGVAAQLLDLPGLGHLAGHWSAANPVAKPAVEATVDFLNAANIKAGK